MSEKMIEPTVAMILEAASTGTRLGTDARAILRAALNHPDARGLFTDEDARPWEPLGEPDQVCVGDEVKWDYYGLTMTATVACVNKTGSLYTAAGLHIGVRSVGTWYVRRPVQELPTEDGAVIVPADGHEFIEQVGDCAHYRRLAYDAASGRWIGWDTLNHEADALFPRHITPGTWKVADQ